MRRRGTVAAMGLAALVVVLGVARGLASVTGGARPAGEPQLQALRPISAGALEAVADAPRYELDAVLADSLDHVGGTVTVRMENRAAGPIDSVTFRAYANADTVYAGRMEVSGIEVDGRAAERETGPDPTTFDVVLPESLPPGRRAEIRMAFRTEIPAALHGYGILAYTRGDVRLAGWHPMLAPQTPDGWLAPRVPTAGDGMVAEAALFHVTFEAPETMTVITTGSEVGHRTADARTAWEFVSGPAREFTVVASDRLQRHHVRVDDVVVYFYSRPAGAVHTSARQVLAVADAAMQVFQRRFGPYPYRELDIVETDVTIGGYEFPGLVLVDAGDRRRGSPATLRYLVAHELAHQWWYGVVGSDSVGEPWLDEALASYTAAMMLRERFGDELLPLWRNRSRPGRPPHVDAPATAFGSWNPYRDAVYLQGAVFLDDLRNAIGQDAFDALLNDWLDAQRFRIATAAEFRAILVDRAGDALPPLEAAWFGGRID